MSLCVDVSAQIPDQLSVCSVLQRPSERLACFDELASRYSRVAKQKNFKEKSGPGAWPGGWEVSETTDPMDDSTTIVLSLKAQSKSGSSGMPYLLVRCREKRLEIFINWSSYLGSDDSLSLRSRFDSEEPRSYSWNASTDHRATFLSGAMRGEFLRALTTSKRFAAEVTDSQNSRLVAVFETSGLGSLLGTIQSCTAGYGL